eukprot:gene6260-6979_t
MANNNSINSSNASTTFNQLTYCNNAFSGRVILTDSQLLIMQWIFALLIPLNVIANAVVIKRMVNSRQWHKVSCWLITVLSTVDLCTGLFTLPLVAVLFIAYGRTRWCGLELATQFVSTSFAYMSVLMTMLIAVDRTMHQRLPTRCSVPLSKRSAKVAVALACTVSTLISGLLTISSVYYSVYHFSIVISLTLIVIMIVIFASYFAAYCQVSGHVRRSTIWNNRTEPDNNKSSATSRGNQRQPRYLRKFRKTVLFIIVTLCLCYVPFLVTTTASQTVGSKERATTAPSSSESLLRFALILSIALVYSNSGLNALIIIKRNSSMFRSRSTVGGRHNRNVSAVAPVDVARERQQRDSRISSIFM